MLEGEVTQSCTEDMVLKGEVKGGGERQELRHDMIYEGAVKGGYIDKDA